MSLITVNFVLCYSKGCYVSLITVNFVLCHSKGCYVSLITVNFLCVILKVVMSLTHH